MPLVLERHDPDVDPLVRLVLLRPPEAIVSKTQASDPKSIKDSEIRPNDA
jgi:hypothetical protein